MEGVAQQPSAGFGEPERLLDGLDDAQRSAVTVDADVLIVEAGAGTGKTRVLTRRIAWGAHIDRWDPRRVLALTFSRKAAGELRSRLWELGLRDHVTAGTFHSIALSILRQHWDKAGTSPPELLTRKARFVAGLLPGRPDRSLVRSATAEIEWASARRIDAARYADVAASDGRRPRLDVHEMATLIQRYHHEKERRRVVDFDDLLLHCARLLQNDPTTADAFRWAHRHLFVDEFQDVNPLQYGLLRLMIGAKPQLCVVGDPRQSIYGWNGADPSLLTTLDDRFPDAERRSILRNHRSTPEILRVANALLPDHAPLEATRPTGPDVTISTHVDDDAEATAIARGLRLGHRGTRRWSSMAVLVRTNAQVPILVEALQNLGVPTIGRGSTALIEDPAVVDALATFADVNVRLHEALAEISTAAGAHDNDVGIDHETADDAVLAFVRLGHEYLRTAPSAWLGDFVDDLRSDRDRGVAHSADAVDVMTMHSSKGLEWETVHLAGMEDGLAPHRSATTPAAADEEQRLVYVGVTRARRELHLHWAKTRQVGTSVVERKPSPYLDRIGAVAASMAPQVTRRRNAVQAAAVLDSVRSTDGGGRESDTGTGLTEALHEWRKRRARANGVAPTHVLSDDAIAEIAEVRPQTEADLIALSEVGPIRAPTLADAVLKIVDQYRPAD